MKVGTTRADEVAEEMEVEAEAGKHGGFPLLSGEENCNQNHEEAKTDIVAEDMVIIRPPGEWFGRMMGKDFSDDTDAIQVWNDSGDGYDGAVATI